MKAIRSLITGTALLMIATNVVASGEFGYCGIIERVVFEPAEGPAERMQIFGAFASYNEPLGSVRGISVPARKGYLYFQMPSDASPEKQALLRREWNDLAALAGTGEAVAFGLFNRYVRVNAPGQGTSIWQAGSIEVRPAAEPPANPIIYQSADVGLVRLGVGNLDYIVEALRSAQPVQSSQ